MKRILLCTVFSLACGGANAAVVFWEDFDEAPAAAVNFAGFDQFSVADGTVDAYTDGSFGLPCPSLGCVDLDGSTNDSGVLTSAGISFLAGTTYTLSFNIAGNQRLALADDVDFGITNAILGTETLTLGMSDRFGLVTRSFTPGADITGSVFFANAGGDNRGALLDFVTIESEDGGGNPDAVPLPAALPLLLGALGLLGLWRRRRSA